MIKSTWFKVTLQKFNLNFWSVIRFGMIIVLFFGIVLYSVFSNKTTKTVQTVQNKELDYFPTSTTNQIVKNDYYTLSYYEKYEQAEWVLMS